MQTSLLKFLTKQSEYLCNMPLNYKAHGVWRYFTERLLLFLPSRSLGFVSRSSSGRILGALRDMCDSNRHHACSANELPLEALKHSVIRYNCVGNTFGCVLAVSTWCRSGQRGKSRTEMERVWKRMTESTGKYQGCVCVCVCVCAWERERERERERWAVARPL